MADPAWPLTVIEADDESAVWRAYQAVYLEQYVHAEIRDWAGRRVRFHAPTFSHAFSESSGYRLSAGVHDVLMSVRRLQRIGWIKRVLAGEGVRIDVLAQIRKDSRGRPRRRRSIIVLDNRYVVVLEVCEVAGFDFDFVTAFPAEQSYLDQIRRGSNVIERRGQK